MDATGSIAKHLILFDGNQISASFFISMHDYSGKKYGIPV